MVMIYSILLFVLFVGIRNIVQLSGLLISGVIVPEIPLKLLITVDIGSHIVATLLTILIGVSK